MATTATTSAGKTRRRLARARASVGLLALLGVVMANAASDNNNTITRAHAQTTRTAAITATPSGTRTATSGASAARWQLEQNRVFVAPPPYVNTAASTSVASVVFRHAAMSTMADESPTTSTVAQSLSSARWDDTPQVMQAARQFKRRGLPLVHLWESQHALLAFGLNQHGKPGLYLTQKIGQ
jgi:hypothetical protein